MAITKIRTFDDPILKQVCEPIKNGNEFKQIKKRMESALRDTDTGVGLAAPQIGEAKRLILVRDRGVHHGSPIAYGNPEIIDHSESTEADFEGCLSFPNYNAMVTRYAVITLRWTTRKDKTREAQFSGFVARIIQHEIDHLNGICRVGDAWRNKTALSNSQRYRQSRRGRSSTPEKEYRKPLPPDVFRVLAGPMR